MESIEAGGNTQKDAKQGDKDALPITQPAPKTPEVPTVDHPIPACKEGEIGSNLKQKHGYCHGGNSKNPFYVYVQGDKELSTFEKRTVFLGYVGIGIAVFSLLAACVAGYFVYHQWREMNAQTGYMNRAAKQARTESATSAVSTAQQLKILQGQLTQQEKAMELDQRAWVGVPEFATIGGSLSPDGNIFSFSGLNIMLRNSGKTPALNLSVVNLEFSEDSRKRIEGYDTEIFRQIPKGLRKGFVGDLFPSQQVLAPGASLPIGASQGNHWTIAYDSVIDSKRRFNIPYILGKITYTDIFSGKKHVTEFCFERNAGTNFVLCPRGNWMN
jgi:hypothetical protein